ncbi:MAG: serine--tRNA ligase [Myxococcales bacterium]|nr:serine--tRNA ligase [Myxococcales bacterium]
MLDIKLIRDSPDLVRTTLQRRNLDPAKAGLDELIALDAAWRADQQRVNELRAERNAASSEIKKLSGDDRQAAIARVKALKDELASIEAGLAERSEQRDRLLRAMPNLLADDVPGGHSDEDNAEISRWGEPRQLGFEPRDHVELGQLTDTIDFERGAKVAGAAFYYFKREAVLLEQALLAYAARELMPRGYIPIATPDLAKDEILDGIGFAPRGPETQVYSVENSDLSLVGTAEITVGGYHGGEILEAESLPLRYLGYSHCFRTEAGAHGKESRGLYRVHQFTKAEMFVLCTPESSIEHHEEIREIEESLLKGLALPYRVVNVCSGDLGAPAFKKYDIEAWMPGRGRYGEVTSCSNCTDYQARRLNIRYRPEAKASPRIVHMLNGTAIAVSRTLLAIYENYQREDASIEIPEVLRPLMGGIAQIPSRG